MTCDESLSAVRLSGSARLYDAIYIADVLQLADVFERFRFVCQSNYEIDPAHCVSAPQLSWESMLKLTDREVDLVSDPEIFRMVDRGIRGGVAVITHRHARANNVMLG